MEQEADLSTSCCFWSRNLELDTNRQIGIPIADFGSRDIADVSESEVVAQTHREHSQLDADSADRTVIEVFEYVVAEEFQTSFSAFRLASDAICDVRTYVQDKPGIGTEIELIRDRRGKLQIQRVVRDFIYFSTFGLKIEARQNVQVLGKSDIDRGPYLIPESVFRVLHVSAERREVDSRLYSESDRFVLCSYLQGNSCQSHEEGCKK